MGSLKMQRMSPKPTEVQPEREAGPEGPGSAGDFGLDMVCQDYGRANLESRLGRDLKILTVFLSTDFFQLQLCYI